MRTAEVEFAIGWAFSDARVEELPLISQHFRHWLHTAGITRTTPVLTARLGDIVSSERYWQELWIGP
jgi:hypothetical protein